MLKLPRRRYCPGEWDCYLLADYCHQQIFKSYDFPDFSWLYFYDVDETWLSKWIKPALLNYAAKVEAPSDGDLSLLKLKGQDCLGTYYEGKIIFMAEYDVIVPVERLGHVICSYWRLKSCNSQVSTQPK